MTAFADPMPTIITAVLDELTTYNPDDALFQAAVGVLNAYDYNGNGEETPMVDLAPVAIERPTRNGIGEFAPIAIMARHLPVLQILVTRGQRSRIAIAEYLKITPQQASNSLAYLAHGVRWGGHPMVERSPHSRQWVATARARAHPLIAK